jgi:hypothetical protein
MFWTDFEPWTPFDTLSIIHLMTVFLSTDWYFELMRGRLTEIYDKDFIDKLLPIREEDYF